MGVVGWSGKRISQQHNSNKRKPSWQADSTYLLVNAPEGERNFTMVFVCRVMKRALVLAQQKKHDQRDAKNIKD